MYNYSDVHLDHIKNRFGKNLAFDGSTAVIKAPLIVLAFTNSCGSNMLSEYLRSTGLFSCLEEQLNAESIDLYANAFSSKSFPEYIHSLWNRSEPGCLFGIKAAWGQLLALKRYNIDRMFAGGVRVIHMERYDVLAQAVSLSVAVQTQQWTSELESQSSDVMYDETSITHFMDYISAGNARIREIVALIRADYIHTCYEDTVRDPQHQVDRITSWLSLPRREATSTPTLQRQATAINEEFARAYRGSFAAKLSAPDSQME